MSEEQNDSSIEIEIENFLHLCDYTDRHCNTNCAYKYTKPEYSDAKSHYTTTLKRYCAIVVSMARHVKFLIFKVETGLLVRISLS